MSIFIDFDKSLPKSTWNLELQQSYWHLSFWNLSYHHHHLWTLVLARRWTSYSTPFLFITLTQTLALISENFHTPSLHNFTSFTFLTLTIHHLQSLQLSLKRCTRWLRCTSINNTYWQTNCWTDGLRMNGVGLGRKNFLSKIKTTK